MQRLARHAQADAVVDGRRAADVAPLENDDVAVPGRLQRAVLEKRGAHPPFFQRDPVRRDERARLDDQDRAERGQVARRDRPAWTRADDDIVDLIGRFEWFKHIPGIDVAVRETFQPCFFRRAVALHRELELQLLEHLVVADVISFGCAYPMAVICGVDERLEPGEILPEIALGIDQVALDAGATIGHRPRGETKAQDQRRPGQHDPHGGETGVAGQLKVFAEIPGNLLERDRHIVEPVEQRFGKFLEEMKLALAERWHRLGPLRLRLGGPMICFDRRLPLRRALASPVQVKRFCRPSPSSRHR